VYLHALGWNPFFQGHWDSRVKDGLAAVRIVEEQKEAYRVAGPEGELAAEVTGRFRHMASGRGDFPAVGDWVAAELIANENKALIHEVLPRRSRLSRKEAGQRTAEQILVTNVDIVFVVTSLNADFNPRRIERYLGSIWESGARPVVILNKADLCPDPSEKAGEIAAIAPGVDVHILSALAGEGLGELAPYLGPGNTVALLGSSGVGKSTIINRLLGSDAQSTREIRAADGRGRHATTYRRLFPLPSGGVLIDTPGMRELQLWDADSGLSETFDDIERLARQCRFGDCLHDSEPRCAVQAAIAAGSLDPARLDNYRKLQRELQFLERRRDAAAQAEEKKIWKQQTKALRRHYKLKPKA
jgi:ribosome biogenesis GTPase